MRLFIAVNFCDEVKNRLIELQEQLRAQAVKGNFTRPENLHLTLAFLGETPEEKMEDLFRILEGIRTPSPFEIVFSRTGRFTHSRKDLWWIGSDPDDPGLPLLKAIHGQLLCRLEEEGFAADKRPFNAHITLGREVKSLRPVLLDNPEIMVRVNRISLMKSEHSRSVLTYTELFARELKNQPDS